MEKVRFLFPHDQTYPRLHSKDHGFRVTVLGSVPGPWVLRLRVPQGQHGS